MTYLFVFCCCFFVRTPRNYKSTEPRHEHRELLLAADDHLISYYFSENSDCYMVLYTRRLWEFSMRFSTKHQKTSPCGGRLDLDCASEQQRRLCWRENVICDRCHYVSQMYNNNLRCERNRTARKKTADKCGAFKLQNHSDVLQSWIRNYCKACYRGDHMLSITVYCLCGREWQQLACQK